MYTCNDAWLHIIRIYNRFARSQFQNLVCNIHLVSPNQASRLHSIRPRHLYSVIIPPMTVLGRKLYRSYESMARHLRHIKPPCAFWMNWLSETNRLGIKVLSHERHKVRFCSWSDCNSRLPIFRRNYPIAYMAHVIRYNLYNIVYIRYFVHLNRLRSIFRFNFTDWGM